MLERRENLTANETRTRNALIDPILGALDWNVSDPSLVTTEYDLPSGRVDYALLGENSKVLAIIEAKRLGERLESHRGQLVRYAYEARPAYAVLTDGDSWELYRVETTEAEFRLQKLMEPSLSTNDPLQSARKLLVLWKANLKEDQRVEVKALDIAETEVLENPLQAMSSEPQTLENSEQAASRWVPLTDFKPTRQSRPSRIRFPDDTESRILGYTDIVLRTVEWLISKQLLTKEHLPLVTRQGATIANSADADAQGAPMNRSRQVGYPSVYVNTDLDREKAKSRAITALRFVQQNPGNVYVQTRELL